VVVVAATAAGCEKSTGPAGPIAAAELAFVVDPAGASAGSAISPAVQVELRDSLGNRVPTATNDVTVAIGANPGGGSLSGTRTVGASGGVATFTDLSIDRAGAGYTLTATASGLAGAASGAFPVTGTGRVVAYVGDNQPGLVGYPVNVRPAVRVTDAGDTPLAGATVTFAVAAGGGSVSGGTAVTNAGGVAQVGAWTLGAAPGVNTLTATVVNGEAGGRSVTFADTGLAASYSIVVQAYGPPVSIAAQAAVDSAAARWGRVIYRHTRSAAVDLPPGYCGPGSPEVPGPVLDVLILVKGDSIDGPGGILGMAGPCYVRSTGQTIAGDVVFDTADVASMTSRGVLDLVMMHEMGHVLGFGTLWNYAVSCLVLPSSPPGTILDTYFGCPRAQAAFDSIGGGSYTGGHKVPVENCGTGSLSPCGGGTVNGHWRYAAFGNELMIGWARPNAPLSLVTVASLEDLGYAVNYAAADPYPGVFTAPVVGGAPPLAMGDDILRIPIRVVDAAGRVVRVIEP
jgi:hypothetical protein